MPNDPTAKPYYVTTPIYYVNDKPHIGHCYTTVVADVAARFQRLLRGQPTPTATPGPETDPERVFFLTGTDEHAEKATTAAAERDLTPQAWSDQNAAAFRAAFDWFECSNDDFIRTSEVRHKDKVGLFIRKLMETGDVYLGDYEGWYDPSQEEYVTENVAREHDFKSPVTKKPLVKRSEKNYFLRLSKYTDDLVEMIAKGDRGEQGGVKILPESRRNEVLGRVKQGLNDVPISRAAKPEDPDWGVLMPDDPGHRVYVWIDALFNYYTAIDTDERRRFWPADVHVIAKDILWFHCVIWPVMLKCLGLEPPRMVYVHSYWVAEGTKMSKSLGNFIDLPMLEAYAERYSLDAVRWYLATQGPLGSTDADFSHDHFVETYNADLANTIGNSISRVGNMIDKYFGGSLPERGGFAHADFDWDTLASEAVASATTASATLDLEGICGAGKRLVEKVDLFINETQPFKLAKKLDEDPANRETLASILYCCAEALRIATLLLAPAMPSKMGEVWKNWDCAPEPGVPLSELAQFAGAHALKAGQSVTKGDVLFMRADPSDARPES